MKHSLLKSIFVVLLATLLSSVGGSYDNFLTKFFDTHVKSVVMIEEYYPEYLGFYSVGTGFVYKSNMVVTAKHVVSDTDGIYRVVVNGQVVAIKNIYSAKEDSNDVAVLTLGENVKVKQEPIAKTLPKVGSRAIIIGNPMDFKNVLSDGYINTIVDFPVLGRVGLIGFSCPVAPGNSGGPIYNEKGEVVGVVFALTEGFSNFNYGSSCLQITKTLKEMSAAQKVKGFPLISSWELVGAY